MESKNEFGRSTATAQSFVQNRLESYYDGANLNEMRGIGATKGRSSGFSLDFLSTGAGFALLLATFIVAWFPEVAFGTRSFVFRDFGMYGYPVAHYFRESFWRGEVPLWNPYSNCGVPFLSQWSTLVCYPGSLFYLLLPLPWSLNAFCLVHLFLGGMGMYFFARRLTNNNTAGAIAGLAYSFNGLTLSCLIWPHYMVCLGWLPWVFLSVDRALRLLSPVFAGRCR